MPYRTKSRGIIYNRKVEDPQKDYLLFRRENSQLQMGQPFCSVAGIDIPSFRI